jgi:hypothetical protein
MPAVQQTKPKEYGRNNISLAWLDYRLLVGQPPWRSPGQARRRHARRLHSSAGGGRNLVGRHCRRCDGRIPKTLKATKQISAMGWEITIGRIRFEPHGPTKGVAMERPRPRS